MDTRNLGLEHLVIRYIDLKRLLDVYKTESHGRVYRISCSLSKTSSC